MIRLQCSCGQQLQAPDQHAGKTVRCPKCGTRLSVPHTGVQSGPTPASPTARPPAGPDEELLDVEPMPAAEMSDDAVTERPPPVYQGPAQPWTDDRPPQRQEKPKRGKGLIIGLIIGAGVLAVLLMIVIGFVVYYAMERVQEARARVLVQNKLKQLGLAAHVYNETHKKLPSHAIYEGEERGRPQGEPLLSWRVKLLPYLEQANLYKALRRDEPWDSPHNIQFLDKMPAVYAHPLDEEANKKGYTYYQVFVSDSNAKVHSPFKYDPTFRCMVQGMTDGSSNTLLFVEASKPVPWTKPEDIDYDPKGPLPKLGLFESKFIAGFADGSVRPLSRSIDSGTLHKLITMNDGQAITLP